MLSCQQKINYDQTPSEGVTQTVPSTAKDKYAVAKVNYETVPNSPDTLIWFGRRAAYLGKYDEAIDIYTVGIAKHPTDAWMPICVIRIPTQVEVRRCAVCTLFNHLNDVKGYDYPEENQRLSERKK